MPTLTFPSSFLPVHLNVGYLTCCAVSFDHELACWGSGWAGVMGQGNEHNAHVPTLIDLGDPFDVDFVSIGTSSACAVSTGGGMKVCLTVRPDQVHLCCSESQCWGYNIYGQLGYDHTNDIGDNSGEMGDDLLFVNLGPSFVVKELQSGNNHRCVLSTDGRVKVCAHVYRFD